MPSLDAGDQLLGGRAVRGRAAATRWPSAGSACGRASRRTRSRWTGSQPVQLRHPAVELVADQDAVLDQVPVLAGDALVVVADGRQAVLDGAVAGDVHDRRAVLQRAELVEGGERRAGVGGLVAERPVQLGGVADRLVDGQPQVGRVDDQVVAAGLDDGRPHLLGEQLGQLGELGVPVPAGAGQVLPAAADRRRERAHGLERAVARSTATAVSSGWMRTRCCVVVGAGGVGVELVLLDLRRRVASTWSTPSAASSRSLQLGEQRDLVGARHGRTGRRRTTRPR